MDQGARVTGVLLLLGAFLVLTQSAQSASTPAADSASRNDPGFKVGIDGGREPSLEEALPEVASLTHYYAGLEQVVNASGVPMEYYEHLADRDMAKHAPEAAARATYSTNVQPLFGKVYPNALYSMYIKVGSRRHLFRVLIDTGSDLTWIPCSPCTHCSSSKVKKLAKPFNIKLSKTATVYPCNSATCRNPGEQMGGPTTSACSAKARACHYKYAYADGSTTAGVLIRDTVTLLGPKALSFSTPLGCGTHQTGNFYNSKPFTVTDGIDGLVGLGTGPFSLPYQLNAKYKRLGVRSIFTVCLAGERGGGFIAFGGALVPSRGVQYSPLPQGNQGVWLLALTGLRVGSSVLYRDSSQSQGRYASVVMDTGTTFPILPPNFQQAVISTIRDAVPYAPIPNNNGADGLLCYATTSRLPAKKLAAFFPTITITFLGSAVLRIPPSTYLFYPILQGSARVCTMVLPGPQDLIIFGELWLRNLNLIHDFANKRMGWVPSDCKTRQAALLRGGT